MGWRYEGLLRRQVSPHLIRLGRTYLSERSVVLEDGKVIIISAGVPQSTTIGLIRTFTAKDLL